MIQKLKDSGKEKHWDLQMGLHLEKQKLTGSGKGILMVILTGSQMEKLKGKLKGKLMERLTAKYWVILMHLERQMDLQMERHLD